MYFNPSRLSKDAQGAEHRSGGGADAEAWQILSPVRAGETGVDGLNRWLQKSFRRKARVWAEPEKYWDRKTCKPLGAQGVLYGDKVINVANARRYDVVDSGFQKVKNAYLANGEIGLVVGQFKGRNWKPKGLPWKIEVEFSSQLGFKFGFGGRDFGDEGDPPLELAYALTIHKAQGSEFGMTFIVIPNPCRLLSRELLYTALTRQREQVVLFHQGDVRALLKLSLSEHSETARRLTNLFSDPKPVEHVGAFLEEGLIHPHHSRRASSFKIGSDHCKSAASPLASLTHTNSPSLGRMAAFDILTSPSKMLRPVGGCFWNTSGCCLNQHIDAAG